MSTTIFIENATDLEFNLYDLDKHHYARIGPKSRYSLKLNYSDSRLKQYNLKYNNGRLIFFINTSGGLGPVYTFNTQYVFLVESQGHRGRPHNKLIITPKNNTSARAPLTSCQSIFDDFIPDHCRW